MAFFSEKTATKYNNSKKDAYSFVNEPINTVQIVGVGNSDLYSGFSPLDLWKNFGFTSIVCASGRQTVQESRDFLELVFEYQFPKLVIIEVDMFYTHKPDSTDFFDRVAPENFEQNVEKAFPVFKFQKYWKDVGKKGSRVPLQTYGYKYNNEVCKLRYFNYMKKTKKKEALSKYQTEKIDALVNFCKSKNAKVVLTVMPSITSWNYKRHNGVLQYARKRKLPFLDLNLKYEEMGIEMENCFRDNGNHLNYRGAKAVTAYLGTYIYENYPFEDLSGMEGYESWDENLEKFEWYKRNS